jgi:hypothetical protein
MTIRRRKHHDLCDVVAEVVGVEWYTDARLPQSCIVCDFSEELTDQEVACWVLIQEAKSTFGQYLDQTIGEFHRARMQAGLNAQLQSY